MNLAYDLNERQREAVEATEGPVLVIAGAGSGKTRALTYRTANLIRNGVDPRNILTLTFTNKAADEMEARIEKLVGGTELEGMWIGTFHSNCLRILANHLDKIGYMPNYVIYDRDDSIDVVKAVLKEVNLSQEEYDPPELLGIISAAKRELVAPDEMARSSESSYYQTVSEIYRRYERMLRDNNAFDFDDLIKKCLELLEFNPDILEYYQRRFKYVQIDEYQDTNHSQYMIANYLSAPERNIFAVGDIDQSLYAFRGADITNVLNFETDFPGARVIRLERNYRSTSGIVELSNEVIKHNEERRPKECWTDRDTGSPAVLCESKSGRGEALFVTKTIQWLTQNYSHGDIAVLYRSNFQSREFEGAFLEHDIPYQIVGGFRFFDRREVKDTLAFLRAMVNPNDITNITRIVSTQNNGIGPSALNAVYEHARNRGLELYDVLASPHTVNGIGPKKGAALLQIKDTLDRLQQLNRDDKHLPDIIDEALAVTGYRELLRNKEDEDDFRQRMSNIGELRTLAAQYQNKDSERTVADFVRDIVLFSDQDDIEDDDAVKLMTVHAAKGLEFPVVFVVGMEENMLPHIRAIQDGEQRAIEEERRICYVAVSRAEERLFLSYARNRMIFGTLCQMQPSRFLDEMPQNYLRHIHNRNVA